MTSEAVSSQNARAAADRLRAEFDHAQADDRRARLLYELGEVHERSSADTDALATYLAASELDGSFTETLEAALRVVERTGARADLGRVLERLVRAASSPAQRVRALTELAIHAALDRADWQGAKEALLEATSITVSPIEAASTWLALEIVAAKLGDRSLRARALAERSSHPSDPTWQALLRFDALREAPFDGAAWSLELEREHVAFAVGKEIDRLASRTGDARILLTRSLRVQSQLVARALDIPAQRPALGVPAWEADLARLVDLRLRLARATTDDEAIHLLSDTLDRVRLRTNADIEREGASPLAAAERVVGYALLSRLERAGQSGAVASLAQNLLATEPSAESRALLALKLSEAAAEQSDAPAALAWLSQATAEGVPSIVASAVEIDLLAGGHDVMRFTRRLRELAEATTVDAAKVRYLLLGAHVQIARERNTTLARELLGAAERAGLDPELHARMRRMFAAIVGDRESYEEAIESLESLAPLVERPLLAFESLRAGALRADGAGAARALARLGGYEGTARAARLLAVFAPFSRPTPAQLRELGADAAHSHAAMLGAAMRALSEGDPAAAEDHLRDAFRDDPSDPVVSTLLASLLRRRRAWSESGDVALQAAETALDDRVAASTFLAAALDLTEAHRGRDAMAALAKADARSPGSAVLLRGWVARFLHGAGHEGDSWPAALWAAERVEEGVRGKNEPLVERGIRILVESEERRTAQTGHMLEAITKDEPWAIASALESLERLAGSEASAAARIGRLRAERGARGERAGAYTIASAERWAQEPRSVPASRLAWVIAASQCGDRMSQRRALEALSTDLIEENAEALRAHGALVAWVGHESADVPDGIRAATRLARLETAKVDSEARGPALERLGETLGADAGILARGLAAAHMIARGDSHVAIGSLRASLEKHPDDIHLWELLRTAARLAGDPRTLAEACSGLAERVRTPELAARLFEHAALAYLRTHDTDGAETALVECLARDPSRTRAFEFLFRRLRDRKEHARVLPLLEAQIPLTDEPVALARLYWERARALREMGQTEAAIEALDNVTTLDPDHVGALALKSEALVRKGEFAQAAELLARLARLVKAPVRNRITAGVAAAELFETRLGSPEKAKDLLSDLHAAGLMSLPMKERLAKVAAIAGDFPLAATLLFELVDERTTPPARIEAGRLGLAIARDRLNDRARAAAFAEKLLALDPGESAALDLVLESGKAGPELEVALERAETAIIAEIEREPPTYKRVERLARVARLLGHSHLERVSISTLAVLDPEQAERPRPAPREEPTSVLAGAALRKLLAPGDDGPVADLFIELSGVLAEAFQPPLSSLGVSKRDRVDARTGLAIRSEVAAWVGAFSLSNFELYVGGEYPETITCSPGAPPRIVIGTGVRSPLDAAARGILARGLLATIRGTHALMARDDETILAIFEAVCRSAKVKLEKSTARVSPEIERLLDKHVSRRVRNAVEPFCRRVVEEKRDVLAWSKAARVSLLRAQIVGSGDVAGVIASLLGVAPEKLGPEALDDARALALVRFALSPDYLAVRSALGLGRNA